MVILVDEAQVMPNESLEALRLLTNLETQDAKLVQVLLFGQPEMETRLAEDPTLLPLRQRILVHCRLAPLKYDETMSYIRHRVAVAGGVGRGSVFRPWRGGRFIGGRRGCRG